MPTQGVCAAMGSCAAVDGGSHERRRRLAEEDRLLLGSKLRRPNGGGSQGVQLERGTTRLHSAARCSDAGLGHGGRFTGGGEDHGVRRSWTRVQKSRWRCCVRCRGLGFMLRRPPDVDGGEEGAMKRCGRDSARQRRRRRQRTGAPVAAAVVGVGERSSAKRGLHLAMEVLSMRWAAPGRGVLKLVCWACKRR